MKPKTLSEVLEKYRIDIQGIRGDGRSRGTNYVKDLILAKRRAIRAIKKILKEGK